MSSIKVAQDSTKGTVILLVGNVLYTGIATIGTIIVARLLGPDGYGLYTLALVIPTAFYWLVGFGVYSACTRYVAFFISAGDLDRAKSITRSATAFLLLCGVGLSVANYVVGGYLVQTLMHRPQLVSYDQVLSLFILGQTMSQCAASVFIGWSSMKTQSVFNVLQAGFKLVVSVGLILAGFGVLGAVLGHTLSYLIQGAVAVLVLYFAHMRLGAQQQSRFREDVRLMIGYAFPIYLGSLTSGFAGQYVTVVLASIASNAVVGYYGAALNVTVAITVITAALANVMFRSFSALHGFAEDTSLAFRYSVKYASFILTPVVLLLIGAAGPFIQFFYWPSYEQSVDLLRLAALSWIPVSIGLTVVPAFFNGVGRSTMMMYITILSSAVLAAAGLLLGAVLGLGAGGIMLALLISNVALTVAGLAAARRYLGVRLSAGPLLGVVVAAAIALIAVYVLPNEELSSPVSLVLDCLVYAGVYLTALPLVQGIDGDDVVRLSIAGDSLGPLRGIFLIILRYERYILTSIGRIKAYPQGSLTGASGPPRSP